MPEQLPAAVIGVSSNDVASHVEFRNKLDLPFPLLADEGGKVWRSSAC